MIRYSINFLLLQQTFLEASDRLQPLFVTLQAWCTAPILGRPLNIFLCVPFTSPYFGWNRSFSSFLRKDSGK